MISMSLGGPLIGYSNATIPMPLTTLHYAQGLTNKTTAFGSLHTTSLLYGVFQTDIGINQSLYYNKVYRVGFTGNPVLNMAIDRWEKKFKLWPQLDVNAYWEIATGKSFLYAGLSNWFELANKTSPEIQQTKHWFCNPEIGFNYTRSKWNYVLEAKYLAASINNLPNVVEYRGFGGKGAVGIYLGFNRKF